MMDFSMEELHLILDSVRSTIEMLSESMQVYALEHNEEALKRISSEITKNSRVYNIVETEVKRRLAEEH